MKKTSANGHALPRLKMAKNFCFGCGKDNPQGMKLKFRFDHEKQQAICDFTLSKRYQGPPGHAHGGVIAVILDEAMGKINKLRQSVALTKTMNIEYMKPTPLKTKLTVVGFEKSHEGRKHLNAAEIRNAKGEVLARCEGLFIQVDPERMFAKHLSPGEATGPLAGLRQKR